MATVGFKGLMTNSQIATAYLTKCSKWSRDTDTHNVPTDPEQKRKQQRIRWLGCICINWEKC